jgi:glycosyltransferase involved in cell wall biosynthesis
VQASKKVTVLHVISSLGMGGAEKMLCDIVRTGAQRNDYNYEVVIINDLFDMDLLASLNDIGVPVHLIRRTPGSRSLRPLIRTIKLFRSIKPSICHCHGFHSLIWAKICSLPFLRPLFVLTVHDTRTISRQGHHKTALTGLIVDRVIAISKSVQEECIDHGLRHVTCVYNGIELERYRQTSSPATDTALSIICVGRVSIAKKGHDTVIEALAICKKSGIDYSVSFVGTESLEEPGAELQLRSLAQDHGLGSQVRFLGKRMDIPDLLARSDLFVLPSRYEGFGLVLVEAMAAGLPVIASDVDGPREILAEGQYGLIFPAGDAASLAAALIDLHASPDRRRLLADLGRSRAEYFSIESTVARYEAIYG